MKAVTKEAAKLSSTQKKEFLKKLNSGSATDLQTIPGVGPEKAGFIKKSRPFKKVEELANVTGFGQATFAKVVSNIKNPGVVPAKSTTAKKSTSDSKKSSTTTKKTTTPAKKTTTPAKKTATPAKKTTTPAKKTTTPAKKTTTPTKKTTTKKTSSSKKKSSTTKKK